MPCRGDSTQHSSSASSTDPAVASSASARSVTSQGVVARLQQLEEEEEDLGWGEDEDRSDSKPVPDALFKHGSVEAANAVLAAAAAPASPSLLCSAHEDGLLCSKPLEVADGINFPSGEAVVTSLSEDSGAATVGTGDAGILSTADAPQLQAPTGMQSLQ